ncbi:MAG: glycosyltransferase family 4 protein [Nitrospirae bacterium]|nr:glycosyltransferase family 4 protein [Nitrospirota bacterium]
MAKSHWQALNSFFSKFRRDSTGASNTQVTERPPRLLIFIVSYPTYSETYMEEEIRSLVGAYDIQIITYRPSPYPRNQFFPYKVINYKDSCLVYGPIKNVNRNFNSPNQQEFIREVDAVIKEFNPDVMHAHYFGMGLLLQFLAERHKIPFTIRTHSMDILSEPQEKIDTMCDAANSPWCQRVLAFPAFRNYLVESGLQSEKIVDCWPVINYARFFKPGRRAPTGRILCAGPAIPKKAHVDFIDLAVRMQGNGLAFDLYTKGPHLATTQAYNEKAGNPVRITYTDPEEMPDVYPNYDWLVYPSDTEINKVGLPAAIAEAQASGLGVCWQELPGRRNEQLEFLGGGGYLFQSIDELPAILTKPIPEEMRQAGLNNAKKCDIEKHKVLLMEVWDHAIREAATAV